MRVVVGWHCYSPYLCLAETAAQKSPRLIILKIVRLREMHYVSLHARASVEVRTDLADLMVLTSDVVTYNFGGVMTCNIK
jgi:hypothetical protein